VRFAVGLLFGMLLVQPETVPVAETAWQTVVVLERVEVAVVAEVVETPFADSLVDWVEVDRQTDCLWTFLQEHEIELTLANVITAGDWTDMHGGACAMIGEDDE
jgi:hypothetical protein